MNKRIHAGFAVVLLICSCGCRAPARGETGPEGAVILSENPMPRLWRISKPFPAGDEGLETDFLAPLGGEVRVSQETPPDGWKRIEVRGDAVDLAKHLGGSGERVCYASTTVRFPEEATAYLMLAATGIKKAWVNGRPVYRSPHKGQTWDKRDSIFAVRFREGENNILLKLGSGKRGWKFSLTLADPWQAWLYQKCDYSRGRLSLSFAPNGKGTGGVIKVTPPKWLKTRAEERGLITVRDIDGRLLKKSEADLNAGIPLELPGPGIYGVEVFGRYPGAFERCGVKYVASGNIDAFVRTLKSRTLAWLKGAGEKDTRHRGCVLFLAESAFGRGWREAEAGLKDAAFAVRLRELLGELGRGRDVLASKRGTFLWGLASRTCQDGQPMPISLPPDYDPRRAYPLVVFLHGSGSAWTGEAFRSSPSEEPYIQIAGDWRGPECRNYSGLAERDVLDAIGFMKQNFKVDPERVYLYGHSIGGHAAWRLGSLYADRFAAVAPFAGMMHGCPLGNMKNLPTGAFHGTEDKALSPVCATYSCERLREAGGRAETFIYEGGGHWVYGVPGDAVRWMLKQGPRKNPKAIDFWTRWVSRGRGSSYWARVLELRDPHEWAQVKLEIKAGVLAGTVRNVRLLRIDGLKKLFPGKKMLAAEVNGNSARLTIPGSGELTLLFEKSGAFNPVSGGEASVVEPVYSEGSVANLFDGKPVRVVVPSGGDEAYQTAVVAEARRLARWNGKFGGMPVVSDGEVNAARPDSHLIILGSAATNSCMRELLGLLPVEEKAGTLAVPVLGNYDLKGRGYAFYYYHPRQPEYRVLVFSSEEAGFFKKVPWVLPDGVYSWFTASDGAPDFVLYDVSRKRYLRVADLGRDWKFEKEFATSPRLKPELGTRKGLYGCLGQALLDVSGADMAYTMFDAAPLVDPEHMRVADLAAFVRGRWYFGLSDAKVVTMTSEDLKYMVPRLHDPSKNGKAFEPSALWPWPSKDFSIPADETRTVCVLNRGVGFGHFTRYKWARGKDWLEGTRTVNGDFLGALTRLAARQEE